MKLKDIWKKGNHTPAPADIIEAGLAVDTTNKRVYSKDSSGNIFEVTHPAIAGVSSDNSGTTVIQDVITDSNGHITTIRTKRLPNHTVSTSYPSGGNDGDVWFRYT